MKKLRKKKRFYSNGVMEVYGAYCNRNFASFMVDFYTLPNCNNKKVSNGLKSKKKFLAFCHFL